MHEYVRCCECEFGQFSDRMTGEWFEVLDATNGRHWVCSSEHRDRALAREGWRPASEPDPVHPQEVRHVQQMTRSELVRVAGEIGLDVDAQFAAAFSEEFISGLDDVISREELEAAVLAKHRAYLWGRPTETLFKSEDFSQRRWATDWAAVEKLKEKEEATGGLFHFESRDPGPDTLHPPLTLTQRPLSALMDTAREALQAVMPGAFIVSVDLESQTHRDIVTLNVSLKVPVDHITLTFESLPEAQRAEAQGTPRLCPGCRMLDGEHDFGPTCTLTDEQDYDCDR